MNDLGMYYRKPLSKDCGFFSYNIKTNKNLKFDMTTQEEVLNDIVLERKRQFEKWGNQKHTKPGWFLILSEEVGDVAKSILDGEGDERMYEELIQVAAVATQICEVLKELKGNPIHP